MGGTGRITTFWLLTGLAWEALWGPYYYAYSNTGIVLYFLVRLPPFTGELIKFQDGNLDLPDR